MTNERDQARRLADQHYIENVDIAKQTCQRALANALEGLGLYRQWREASNRIFSDEIETIAEEAEAERDEERTREAVERWEAEQNA